MKQAEPHNILQPCFATLLCAISINRVIFELTNRIAACRRTHVRTRYSIAHVRAYVHDFQSHGEEYVDMNYKYTRVNADKYNAYTSHELARIREGPQLARKRDGKDFLLCLG